MNRIKDYFGFVGWFAGLGYILLWPVTAADLSGKPFGASLLCRDGSASILDFLCNSAHPLQLPPALHALGFLSVMFVTIRLLLHAFRRTRRAAAATSATAPITAAFVPPVRKSPPLHRAVKPRTHFGLRGMPH